MHIWVRAEERQNERRVGIMPDGVKALCAAGARITVEQSPARVVPIEGYAHAGAEIAPQGSWRDAPDDAVILGLKELAEDGTALRHTHIMFGHAFKGQPGAAAFLGRFTGRGGLLDLEYLTDEDGRRVAAFGYWAGYAGAAVTALAWAAQARGGTCPPVGAWDSAPAMLADVQVALQDAGATRPSALVIGAAGRVGSGARAACAALGIPTTDWDMAETAHGGPFPEVLAHGLFFNCILAGPGVPVFVPADAGARADRRLRVIGDIACDPGSSYNPVPVYDAATDWQTPVTRVADSPVLDVMAIDNLPSLLPAESSEDFAGQLLPHLKALVRGEGAVWTRARALFDLHRKELTA